MSSYVSCSTRLDGKPDRCYGNIPNAFKSVQLPNLGNSDHKVVHLIPSYKPVVQSNPVITKTVKVWSPEHVDQLQGCFECTKWNVFIDSSDNVSEATDVITDYVTFCENMIIPTKEVKIYANNKPWITKTLKNTLNEKKVSFQSGGRGEREWCAE